jgi:hypothetical protein
MVGTTVVAARRRGVLSQPSRAPARSIDFDRFARFYDWDTDDESDDFDFYRNLTA